MPSRTPATKRPAQSPATPMTEQPTPVTVRQFVPRTIDLITDAVSEMLTTGTNDQSLENLLYAALEHISRRTFERGIGIDDQNSTREFVETEIGRCLRPWKHDVIAQWHHNRRQSPAAVEPKTVTARIRTNARGDLEERLERFLGRGTPEEIRFLAEVMANRESVSYTSPTVPDFAMALGEAFELELGNDRCYLCVPGRMADQVEKYVAALRAIEDKAA
jgi:hypothetical protein